MADGHVNTGSSFVVHEAEEGLRRHESIQPSNSTLGLSGVPLGKPEPARQYRLRYVVPDLPLADDILPFLRTIDQARWYSNFGPMERAFRREIANLFFPALDSQNIVTACSGALAIESALIAHSFPLG